ncbi:MAG: tetratricopeptide repeat protein [Pseudomonadaceae bacterium]|nr:tetratricopeptide repeat protein [Pseudomonadaceae bacterium]
MPTLLALVLLVWSSGCATPPITPPVIEEAGTAPIEREVVEPDTAATQATPDTSAATIALLAQAQAALSDDAPQTAITYLERAVRIDPRNPQLWIELSAAHLADNNLAAANQHIRKAIALAGNDPAQSRSAWLQMADIREAEGNRREADAIRRRFSAVRG